MKPSECKELLKAMDELEKEKGIKKDYLLESLESSLVTAYKKNYDSADNVEIAGFYLQKILLLLLIS